ncbi:unnamed protein product, partial [Brachionus calyciflorus]
LSIIAVVYQTQAASTKQLGAIKIAQTLVRKLVNNEKLQRDIVVVLDDLKNMEASEIRQMIDLARLLVTSQGMLSKNTEDEN